MVPKSRPDPFSRENEPSNRHRFHKPFFHPSQPNFQSYSQEPRLNNHSPVPYDTANLAMPNHTTGKPYIQVMALTCGWLVGSGGGCRPVRDQKLRSRLVLTAQCTAMFYRALHCTLGPPQMGQNEDRITMLSTPFALPRTCTVVDPKPSGKFLRVLPTSCGQDKNPTF